MTTPEPDEDISDVKEDIKSLRFYARSPGGIFFISVLVIALCLVGFSFVVGIR
jgi:hypothetical protein